MIALSTLRPPVQHLVQPSRLSSPPVDRYQHLFVPVSTRPSCPRVTSSWLPAAKALTWPPRPSWAPGAEERVQRGAEDERSSSGVHLPTSEIVRKVLDRWWTNGHARHSTLYPAAPAGANRRGSNTPVSVSTLRQQGSRTKQANQMRLPPTRTSMLSDVSPPCPKKDARRLRANF